MRQHPGEEGVSEVVGVMLLIGVTVIGVALVGIVFLSAPQPDEIPHAAIAAGNTSGRLTLAHEGGDPLRAGEYRIYVDTPSGLVEKTGDFSKPEGGIWSIGKSINYTGTETPRRVVVTVISGGSETVLSEPAFVGRGSTFSPDPVEPGDTNGDDEPEEPFIDFVINENVFVYGTALQFSGNSVVGPGATVIVTDGLTTSDLNGGASIAVSEIYINDSVTLDGGGADLGSAEKPGAIYINGDLNLMNGGRDIYGDVYVSGNLYLKDARIHGNMYVQGKADLIGGEIYGDLHQGGDLYLKDTHTHGDVYVDGDVELDWTPTVDGKIEYTGDLTKPNSYRQSILDKCIQTLHVPEVPSFEMPDQGIPSTKPAEWYTSRGYASSGPLTDNKKIFAPSYSSPSGATASNVVIIASDGDISITNGWSNKVTGIFFAPNGKVTFNGASFEGVVIARNGFFVTSGGTAVTFKNIAEYISDPDDYPF